MSYKIGEIAKLTDLTTRTVRYYEGLGLLGKRESRPNGQIRSFDNTDLERLKKIQILKDLGLSLEEIGEVIELYFTDGQILEGKRQVIQILKGHIEAAEGKIEELSAFKRECERNILKLETIIAHSEKN
ncbi:MerR family transcriptional regulator [Ethanoligenens sp.]|uniref:MerR family transcriptional regulator n=1 Tax=Ethanoligenens sp. TaxID=2099655 RepID=UPI0039E90538